MFVFFQNGTEKKGRADEGTVGVGLVRVRV